MKKTKCNYLAFSIFLFYFFSNSNYLFSQAIKIDNYSHVGINCAPNGYSMKVDIKDGANPMKIDGGNEGALIIDGNSASYIPDFTVNGDIWFNGERVTCSDVKLKKNIDTLNSNEILSKIQKIRGRKYNYKNQQELLQMHEKKEISFLVDTVLLSGNNKNKTFVSSYTKDGKQYGIKVNTPRMSQEKQIGFVAQEIKDEFPELISFDSTRMVYGIQYEGFIPILLEAIKAQQKQINQKQKLLENGKETNQETTPGYPAAKTTRGPAATND